MKEIQIVTKGAPRRAFLYGTLFGVVLSAIPVAIEWSLTAPSVTEPPPAAEASAVTATVTVSEEVPPQDKGPINPPLPKMQKQGPHIYGMTFLRNNLTTKLRLDCTDNAAPSALLVTESENGSTETTSATRLSGPQPKIAVEQRKVQNTIEDPVLDKALKIACEKPTRKPEPIRRLLDLLEQDRLAM